MLLGAWSLAAAEPSRILQQPGSRPNPRIFTGTPSSRTATQEYQDAIRFLNADPLKEGGLKVATFIFSNLLQCPDKQQAEEARSGLERIRLMRLGLELVSALETNGERAAHELIQKGASLEMRTAKGYTPLILACETNNFGMVKALVTAGARVTNGSSSLIGSTPLHFAAMHDETNLLAFLLEHGAPVDIRSRRGDTPLYMAVNRGRFRSAEFLLRRGADANLCSYRDEKRTEYEYSPLMAVGGSNSDVRMIDLLLEHGAKLEAKNQFGRTALMDIATRDAAHVIEHLIEKGADVNAAGPAGHTALILAAYNGRMETVRLLLGAGANPLATATDSKDPNEELDRYDAVELAVQQGHPEVAEMIEKAQERRTSKPRPFAIHPRELKRRESRWL